MEIGRKSIGDVKEALQTLPPLIPWSEVEVDEVYHLPPICTLARRDVIILEKKGDTAKYRRIDTTDNKEVSLHETSILARLLVKKKVY